jgi:hypothetical protein
VKLLQLELQVYIRLLLLSLALPLLPHFLLSHHVVQSFLQGNRPRIMLLVKLRVRLAPLDHISIPSHGWRPSFLLESGILIFELETIFDERPTMGESEWLVLIPGLEGFQGLKCLHNHREGHKCNSEGHQMQQT